MGFFDKIKKAIDDSGVVDAAKAAVKGFTESTESKTVETPQKQIVEEKVAEKEVKETKPKEPPKPACEYGECVLCEANGFDEKLYFTCNKDQSCPKKTKNVCGKLWDEEMLPIIKAFATYQNSTGDWDVRRKNLRSAANKIVETYVPQLNNFDFVSAVCKSIEFDGVEKNNQFLVYLVNLKRKNVEIPPEKVEQFRETVLMVRKYETDYNRVLDANAEWLYNPSLYDFKKPSGVIQSFLDFGNPKWTKTHLLDDSVVDINQFYNADGTIKDMGEYDELDDNTIYGVIEKWYLNNKNEETFEKERRLAKCKDCARHSTCQMIGMHEDCPSYTFSW